MNLAGIQCSSKGRNILDVLIEGVPLAPILPSVRIVISATQGYEPVSLRYVVTERIPSAPIARRTMYEQHRRSAAFFHESKGRITYPLLLDWYVLSLRPCWELACGQEKCDASRAV